MVCLQTAQMEQRQEDDVKTECRSFTAWFPEAYRIHWSLELRPERSGFPYILRVPAKAEVILIGPEFDLDPFTILSNIFYRANIHHLQTLAMISQSEWILLQTSPKLSTLVGQIDLWNGLQFIWSSCVFYNGRLARFADLIRCSTRISPWTCTYFWLFTQLLFHL